MPDQTRVENVTEEKVRPASTGAEGREPWPEEAEPASRRERARSYFHEHPQARWILILVLLFVVASGAYIWHYYSIRESTDDAEIDGHIVPVSARVGGTVTIVNVRDNQYVGKGDVIAQLDPVDYQVALQRAQADLANAEATANAARTGVPITHTTTFSNVSTAQANLNASRKDVDAARARVREAEANYTKLSADLKRAQQLIAKDEISQQQYDAAVAAFESAKAGVDAATATVASGLSQVSQAEAGLRAAQTAPQQVQVTIARHEEALAAVKRAQAVVQQAQLNLDYTTVRAPFAGIVSKRSVEPGQVITSGQPLFALIDLEDVYVTANFKETQLGEMCPGQPVTVHVDTFDHDYRGHVDSLSGATGARFSLLPPENATGNFVKVVQRIPVKIVFEPGEDPGHSLRPGMSVEPTVLVNKPCIHTFAETTPNPGPVRLSPGLPAASPSPGNPPAPAPTGGPNR